MRKQKENIILKYLNLDLNKLPSCIDIKDGIDIKSSDLKNEKTYKVYKYVKMSDINILITNALRLDSSNLKIKNMNTLPYYLEKKNENEYAIFLNMLKNASIDEIEEIEKEQKEFSKKIPTKIKYPKDYLWQIYYIAREDKYYMIVPAQETEVQAFLYLLKKKIENSKEKIYVPICNLDYSGEFIENSKINKISEYLFTFTKQWPAIYEIYSKANKTSMTITGNLEIYENITSDYKMYYKDKEEINDFYMLLKTLFYIQTELSYYFNFEIIINEIGELKFYYNNREITYSNLEEFYKTEIEQAKENVQEIEKLQKELNLKLSKLKTQEKKLNLELLNKQKQISTFLECKKTFLGRVKYFFKYSSKKKVKHEEEPETEEIANVPDSTDTISLSNSENLENLIVICKDLIALTTKATTTRMDIQNLAIRIDVLKKKIENATLYIEEIESHKKSIFEFWKFTNKDESNQLAEGIKQKENETKIKKKFNINEDLTEFAQKMDLLQRKALTKQEQDSILIAKTELLKNLNDIAKANEIAEEEVQRIQQIADFINVDTTNLDHRENLKNVKSIIQLSDSTKAKNYTESISEAIKNIKSALNKVKLENDLPVYALEEPKKELTKFELNPTKLVSNVDEINLYRVNIKAGTPILAFTNIIFFNNINKTLPVGMDYSTEVLLDLSEVDLIKKREKENHIVKLNDNSKKTEVTKINITEFNI